MAGRDLNENKRREEQRMNAHVVANVAAGSKRKEWTLLIDNLLWTTTERKVLDVISSLGVIDVIKILHYRKNGSGQQSGFLVRLGMELSAQIILERLPNQRIDSRLPRVSLAAETFRETDGLLLPLPGHHPPLCRHLSYSGPGFHQASNPSRSASTPGLPVRNPSPVAGPSHAGNDYYPRPAPIRAPAPAPALAQAPALVPVPARVEDPIPPFNIIENVHEKTSLYRFNAGPVDDLFEQNRQVTGGAIQQAIQDHASGDFYSAIETLTSAITVIKQSQIGDDSRCKVLIDNLKFRIQCVRGKKLQKKHLKSTARPV